MPTPADLPHSRETYERCGGLLRYRPAMDDEDGHFGERAAARYDQSSDIFDLAAIEASSFYTTVQDATDHRGQVTSIANSQLNTYD